MLKAQHSSPPGVDSVFLASQVLDPGISGARAKGVFVGT